ncbi:hypothetical protein E2562_012556 [Oryza meyeriana var. granulata]|uniref:Uncharacterized protein n=1 Tax=Oryza meyeriana var. granulata TaxID=110450 RepID=A0A6G1D2V4_9ORYZ|nr:hypothetical protein E2562_012556 [Oryza meyeriana var. granulata]
MAQADTASFACRHWLEGSAEDAEDPPVAPPPFARRRRWLATSLRLGQPGGGAGEAAAKAGKRNFEEAIILELKLPTTGMEEAASKTEALAAEKAKRPAEAAAANAEKLPAVLRGFRVAVDERDVSMDASLRRELQLLLAARGRAFSLPQLLVGGCLVGRADEVRRLHESGELRRLSGPTKSTTATKPYLQAQRAHQVSLTRSRYKYPAPPPSSNKP